MMAMTLSAEEYAPVPMSSARSATSLLTSFSWARFSASDAAVTGLGDFFGDRGGFPLVLAGDAGAAAAPPPSPPRAPDAPVSSIALTAASIAAFDAAASRLAVSSSS